MSLNMKFGNVHNMLKDSHIGMMLQGLCRLQIESRWYYDIVNGSQIS